MQNHDPQNFGLQSHDLRLACRAAAKLKRARIFR